MKATTTHNLTGILTSLDFRKAFDALEWPFIMKTLDCFNFVGDIKRWVNTFYSNIESTVINNGFITNWFKPSKESARAALSLLICLFSRRKYSQIKFGKTPT